MDCTAADFPVSEVEQLDSSKRRIRGCWKAVDEILGLAWIEVELEERLCGGMSCFFVGGGISGEAFSWWISDGMLFSRCIAAWFSLRLIPRVITCFSCLNLACGS